MVGLSVVLEAPESGAGAHTGCGMSPRVPKLIDKTTAMFATTTSSTSCASGTGFLEHCFLCKQRLLTGKDIYMYRGDRGFCSVECRSRHMAMDDEACSTAAMKPRTQPPPSADSRRRKGPGNPAAGLAAR